MADIQFETVSFREEEQEIVVTLYNLFELRIPRPDHIHAQDKTLSWEGVTEEEGRRQFGILFTQHLNRLRNKLTSHPSVFVHRSSGIPLLGSLAFGIVDRGTNMLEVKPITGCNINCTFCSVDEGDDTGKIRDYLIEREYLVQEIEKILAFKGEPMDIWLNTQGEPMLYAELCGLIEDCRKLPSVNKIALITNGTMLSQPLLTKLQKAGLTQLDVSLNAIDGKRGLQLAGTARYNGKRVQEMLACAVQMGLDVVIAPVYLKGINEQDIEDVVRFAEQIGCRKVYIQNFLPYKMGRNPVHGVNWPRFERYLQTLQEGHPTIDFIVKDHTARKTKPLPKPFRKGERIKAVIVAQGRYPQELLAAAKGYSITIPNGKTPVGKEATIEITRDKDGIYYGEEK